jgi:hypothetical protein
MNKVQPDNSKGTRYALSGVTDFNIQAASGAPIVTKAKWPQVQKGLEPVTFRLAT